MTIPILQIDAFTDTPFKGNPAAVCLLSKPKSELRAKQISSRSGDLHLRLDNDRIHIGGHAVTIFKGELLI